MIATYTYKQLTWIDLESPSSDELQAVVEQYNIHPAITQNLSQPSLRSKVEEYDEVLYLVLHFPTISSIKHGGLQQEIDFVIGKNFVITVHYEMIDSLHNFIKIFEVNSSLEKGILGEHAGFLFFYMMKHFYQDMTLELDSLRHHTKSVEEKIFNGNERIIVETLSEIAHKVLDFREATRFHKSVLTSFEQSSIRMFGANFQYYAKNITDEYYKLWEVLETLRETVVELKKTNDSLLAYKTNETIRFLTVLTFTVLPLQIVPSIFTTNVFVEGAYSTEAIHVLSITASLFLFMLFKFKKWI